MRRGYGCPLSYELKSHFSIIYAFVRESLQKRRTWSYNQELKEEQDKEIRKDQNFM